MLGRRYAVITVIVAALTLSSCSLLQEKDTNVSFDETISHPDLPSPVESRGFQWRVVTKDNVDDIGDDQVLIALDYEDSLTFRAFLEDIKRYVLESNNVICYYRRDLDEKFCQRTEKMNDE